MTGVFMGAAGAGAVITATSNWGTGSGSGGANVDSGAVTLVVPPGNSGGVFLDVSDAGVNQYWYKKNAGSFTNFTSGTVVTFANGDTLTLRVVVDAGLGSVVITPRDNDSCTISGGGFAIGTFSVN